MAKGRLYQQLLDANMLLKAWKLVKAKGSVGGVDGVSLSEFEQNLHRNLHQLADDLKN